MAIEHEIDSPFAEAVRVIGSQSATARLIGKSQSTVYARLKSGKPVWAEDVAAISEASGVPIERLRPDLKALFESVTPTESTMEPAR